MEVDILLATYWPDTWTEMFGKYAGSTELELQAFLDNQVVWVNGQTPPTAAEMIAIEPTYQQLVLDREAEVAQEEADTLETKQDVVINALLTKTNAEINTYVDNNVTNIAEAQDMFKIVLKLLALQAKRGAFN